MAILKFLQTLFLLAFSQQAQAPPLVAPQSSAAPSVFRISGRVIDGIGGQPLAHAAVTVNASASPNAPAPPDPARVEVADVEGRFAFAGVQPGKYVLSARHRGYPPQMYQQHETFTTAIVVGPGLESENLIFTLRPGASMSGEIRDESDDPVRHASVMLFHENLVGGKRRISLARQASSDDRGHYHFAHLAPGTYFVSVSAQPWYAQHNARHRVDQGELENAEAVEQNQALDVTYQTVFFPNSNDLAGAAPIELHAGDMAVADFRMSPIPALHVLVRTSATKLNQGLNIQLTQTVAEGTEIPISVAVNQLAPGLWQVSGLPPAHLGLAVMTPNGNESLRRTRSVQVSNDAEIDTTENPPSSAAVSGTLKMDDGSPAPQPARVLLRSFATGQSSIANVSAAGEFSFKNNPAEIGSYELIIIEPQGLFIRSLFSTGVKTTGRSFQIASAQDVNITINASKGTGRVTGIALKKDKPVSGVMIVLAPLDSRGNPALFRRDQSDSDGTFALNAIVPGRYTLMAIEDGWNLEWADPDVLKKYLAGGESVEIIPHQKSEFKVNVQ